MRILFATEYYHPFTPGGTPWSLGLLARELGRRGEQVAVVTPNYGAPAREDVEGVPVFRFPFWRRLRPGASLAPGRDHVNPLFHLLMARALVRAARALGADVIHAQEKHALVGSALAGWWLGKPVVLSLRDYGLICPISTCLLSHTRIPRDCGSLKLQRQCVGEYIDLYIGPGRLRRLRVRAAVAALYLDAWLKSFVMKRVDRVVAVSAELLAIYTEAGRVRADRAGVSYNLPPPLRLERPDDRARRMAELGLPDAPLVLYVGKLSPGKGFPVFEASARLVAQRGAAASFAAVGDAGALRAGAATAVRLLGPRSQAEVQGLYALADIVVHPAVWPEPFSRVPLEAAAAGRPVVATRVGGTPEAVEDKETGLLVERSDPEGLARAIEQLLADPVLREGLGRRASERIGQRFGPDRVVDGLIQVYRGVAR